MPCLLLGHGNVVHRKVDMGHSGVILLVRWLQIPAQPKRGREQPLPNWTPPGRKELA